MSTEFAQVAESHPAYRGQAAYTRRSLRMYDTIAYRIDCRYFWRCPVERLLELYDTQVSGRHLDVGIATGYLVDRCSFPMPAPEITLMDLNPRCLDYAARRLRRYRPRTHQADVLAPWGLPEGGFDSVAMSLVLNCLPGSLSEKAVSFEHARAVLAPGGRLFGATLLSHGVEHTRLSRRVMRALNRRGVFDNLGDDRGDLEDALRRSFPTYELTVHGAMALFSARVEER